MEQPEGCPPVGSGSSQQPSSFSQVIFHNVGQSYLPDVNMECRYSITPQLQPHAKDWVGIFKVGWSSPRDYYTFLWASTPGPSEEIVMLQLLFQAYYLPKNDGEFYQFCYVTHMGEIRGASAPFQFRAPSPTDELFTLEMDECSGLLMVTTKTSHLEDCLKESNCKVEELVQCNAKLEEERRGLLQEVEDLRQNMKGSDTDKMNLAQELQREQNKVRALEQETKALQEKYGSSVARLRKLNEDHQALVQKVTQEEMEIDLLQKDVKKLTVEKQQLEKQKSNENEEKELYMAQSKELDLQNSKLQHELDSLQSKLEKADEELAVCKEEISGFNSTFSVLEQSPEVQEIENTSAKICEQLRQSEDQRAASEQRLQLLSEEILEATTTRDKTMADLHRSRLHCSKLEELLTHVGAQVQGFDVAKEGSENHAQLQKANEDLKLRLMMGAEHYKEKYKDCIKLQKEVSRLKEKLGEYTLKSKAATGSVEKLTSYCLVQEEEAVSSSASECGDLLSQVKGLAADKVEKYKKYKQMFKKEKENSVWLEEKIHQLESSLNEEKRTIQELMEQMAHEQADAQMRYDQKTCEVKQLQHQLEKLKKDKDEDKETNVQLAMELMTRKNSSNRLENETASLKEEIKLKNVELLGLRRSFDKKEEDVENLHEDLQRLKDQLKVPFNWHPAVQIQNQDANEDAYSNIDDNFGPAASPQHTAIPRGISHPEACPTTENVSTPESGACALSSPSEGLCGVCNVGAREAVFTTPPSSPRPSTGNVVISQPSAHFSGLLEEQEEQEEQEQSGETSDIRRPPTGNHAPPTTSDFDDSLQQTPGNGKQCPICELAFPPAFDQVEFESHVRGHWKECPMCGNQFPPNYDQELFVKHVHSHFGEAAQQDFQHIHADDTIF